MNVDSHDSSRKTHSRSGSSSGSTLHEAPCLRTDLTMVDPVAQLSDDTP